jgi:hypothetical protein
MGEPTDTIPAPPPEPEEGEELLPILDWLRCPELRPEDSYGGDGGL